MPSSSPSATQAQQKPPIVLVHGFRGSPLGLDAIANDLRTAGYTIFVPAISPFAGATALEAYDPESYVQYLLNYLSEHKIEQPILVGHSMGSVICACVAHSHPELLHEKLVLLSPISSKPPQPIAIISPLSALLPRKVVDYVTTKFLFVPHNRKLLRETLDLTHHCTADRPPHRSDAMKSARFAAKYAINDFLPIPKKILLLAGEKDRLIKKAQTEKLAQKMNAQASFLPGSGHLHNYEKPHETATEILRFIQA